MKHSIFILSIGLCVAVTLTAGPLIAQDNLPAIKDKQVSEKTLPGWNSYSYGLYYKNLALENPQSPESSINLKKAQSFFQQSLETGESLDLIYYQLSECYYYLYDFNNSLDYANKSIMINSTNIQPYNRIYNIYMRLKNYAKAAEILERYLASNNGNIYVQNLLAEHYLNHLRDIDRAIEAYKKVIVLSSQEAVEDYFRENALYNLAYIQFQKGNIDDAISLFEKTLETNKNNLNALYMLAVIYMEEVKLDNAQKYASQYYQKRKGNITINSILGQIHYIKNSPEATKYLIKAARSKSIDGTLARAIYYEILNNDARAEQPLEAGIKIRPKMTSLHIALGKIYERAEKQDKAFNEFLTAAILLYQGGMYTEAAYYLNRAEKKKEGVAGIYYYLGRIHEDSEKISLAIVNYKKAEELNPNIDLIIHIGYLYGVRGDYNTAIDYFSRASSMEPENSKPYFFSGLVSLWEKNYPQAEHDIKKAISLTDDNETYYFYLAIVMEKLDKFDEAVSSLEQAIKYNPQSGRAYNFLGYLYAERNIKIDESHTLILRALELEPENGAYIDSLGWVYYRKGNFRDALGKLLEAEKVLSDSNSPDPVVYDHIGDTYLKLGDSLKAVQYWKKSLEYEKNDTIMKKIEMHQKNIP